LEGLGKRNGVTKGRGEKEEGVTSTRRVREGGSLGKNTGERPHKSIEEGPDGTTCGDKKKGFYAKKSDPPNFPVVKGGKKKGGYGARSKRTG